MDLYTIYPVTYENETFFCVYENRTEQVYDFFFFDEDAQKCKTFLEKGGAFEGFTPGFMLRKAEVKEDINNRFSEL
jgi:hypothetical protein